MDTRIIHSNLYGSKTRDILSHILEYGRNTTCGKNNRSFNSLKIEVAPDGEIVMKIDDCNTWNYRRTVFYSHESNDQVLEWIAQFIKNSVYKRLRYLDKNPSDCWKRDNGENIQLCDYSTTHNFIIVDLYCLYDLFKDRKNINKKYPEFKLEEFRGTQRDPISTEFEIARREEVERINTEKKAAIQHIIDEYYAKRRADEQRLGEWKKTEIDRVTAEYDEKINEVNSTTNNAMQFMA